MTTQHDQSEGVGSDPIEYFLEDIAYQGKSERTSAAYERVLRGFEEYLDSRAIEIDEANHRDCMAYVHQLRGQVGPSTVATYASYLHRFFDYMMRVGTFDDNPMTLVLEEIDESINTDPPRRDVSVDEMRSFLTGVGHPLHRAVIVTLLKTGIRAGELCNLDVRDLHLVNHVPDVDPRAAIDTRPGSLYIDSTPTRGASYNGEERTASNKRQRATTIPVDPELERVLRAWLAVRPDPTSTAAPLFLNTGQRWGRRLRTDAVHRIVTENAQTYGWYEQGGGPETNVTPHYFRHFFTTHLRGRTGDRGVVKYLRGDVAQDVIDTYTHDWGDRVRDVYRANIYSIL
jgi:integrase